MGKFRKQARRAWVGRGGGAKRKERNKVSCGLWPTGQNQEDLGVLLRNLDFIRQCVGVIEGF